MRLSKSDIAVIGSGFAGLSAASVLAQRGANVELFEKNDQIGGRARQFCDSGYTFDMGPSWYWMPDVIEKYFNHFGYTASDFYELVKLDPGFQMIFGEGEVLKVPANYYDLLELFESIEKGAADRLNDFMNDAEIKYNIGIKELVYQPGHSISEFLNKEVLTNVFKLQVFSNFSKHIRGYFKDRRLIALMEFPILFLGSMPKNTPALYSLMNYSGLKAGTYYPKGGFGKIIEAMEKIALGNGVKIHTSTSVTKIETYKRLATGLNIRNKINTYDGIIGAADYHHIEQSLLDEGKRGYSEKYWQKRTLAPSSLIFYLGIKEKLSSLEHHNLFFDEDLNQHGIEIYEEKKWPSKPLFYVCCPSKTDESVAPKGKENVFILMPIAPGLNDSEEIREKYFEILVKRLSKHVGKNIEDLIEVKRSYCIKDFQEDYNSFLGNAYGLANTLKQTAILKPKLKSKKLDNLFFAGQLTVPGPGVPPSLISGQVAAREMIKYLNQL